ncbi:phosphatase PAP2 family protein [Pseudomonas oryzae]|uniref:Membrane-associated enzyme, PAP2 (Acid phosphatase) superfamily n=1 Tax=Pseudomonas oryzae TaxID=1392877 RepID=A0A1H1LIZ4_9PSED|nr:phosphatase PAP2 family protein [Pseudomonas oryzae]SDR74282.1 Membrane-associated enzyme, PAP2 (acid phosphatase) superfamily [Pseudomonas oryzae]
MRRPLLHSRPLRTWLALGLPLGLMALLLIVEPTRLDFALSDLFYQPGVGFSGRHSAFLEDFLHDRAKQGVILIGVVAIVGLLASWLHRPWAAWRRTFGYLVLGMGLSTAIVNPIKTLTGVHCPWDLSRYGGAETFTPLLAERAPTLHPGRCWPGGHASSGFTLFALYFVLRDRRPRLARAALLFALGLGSVFSIGRVMQGAHFLSHNLWTALFDWLICLGCYRLLLYRPQQALAQSIARDLVAEHEPVR